MQLKCQLLFIRICPPRGARRPRESTAGSQRMARQKDCVKISEEFQLERNNQSGPSLDWRHMFLWRAGLVLSTWLFQNGLFFSLLYSVSIAILHNI